LLWCGLQWRIMPLIAAGTAGGIFSFLVTGHAATASPVWLAAPAVAVHLLGAAYWIGALYPLYRAASHLEPGAAAMVLVAFSNRAVWLVLGIVVSGLLISWVQLTALSALWTTPYGYRLTAKVAIFGVVLALAAYNKLLLTPKIAADAAVRLRWIIRLEFLLILLVLGAAVSLTMTEPPRVLRQGDVPHVH
jgi:copper transport protein